MKEIFLQTIRLKEGISPNNIEKILLPYEFQNSLTIFIGENGSGKSTLLEAIAINLGCNPEGGSKNFNFKTEDTHSDLYKRIVVAKGYKKPKDLYFYRSESFYNLLTEMRRLDSFGSFDPQVKTYYGGTDLHDQSHGESMQSLYTYRFKPNGLYILDEPEASLSPLGQLAFIKRIIELSKGGAQFIIATHSPLVMSIPGADLINIGESMEKVCFTDTDAYSIYRAVLLGGNSYLEDLLD